MANERKPAKLRDDVAAKYELNPDLRLVEGQEVICTKSNIQRSADKITLAHAERMVKAGSTVIREKKSAAAAAPAAVSTDAAEGKKK